MNQGRIIVITGAPGTGKTIFTTKTINASEKLNCEKIGTGTLI